MSECTGSDGTNCREVLAELWLFLDNECDQQRRELLRQHLDDCAPCLEELGVEEQLKALLARKCGGDHAPDRLRERLRESIRQVVVQHSPEGTIVEITETQTELRGW